MIDASGLNMILQRNFGVIQRQIKDITHEQSLIQPPFRGNCMNWVLGHLVMSRQRILIMTNQPTFWTQEQCNRYERGSEPIVDESEGLPFEKIVADLATSQQRIQAWLENAKPEDLDVEIIPHNIPADAAPIWDWMEFLLWHEAYHLGNLELLRQLAGMNDRVIG
jgi:hypothetical protein